MRTLALLLVSLLLLTACEIRVCCDNHETRKVEQKKET